MLLMLEDDAERVERFTTVLRVLAPGMPLHVWRDAHLLMREAGPLLSSAALISLDHDLCPSTPHLDLRSRDLSQLSLAEKLVFGPE